MGVITVFGQEMMLRAYFQSLTGDEIRKILKIRTNESFYNHLKGESESVVLRLNYLDYSFDIPVEIDEELKQQVGFEIITRWGDTLNFKQELMDKYICWDCEKEIENVNLDEETKAKCPRDVVTGVRYIICNDCKDKEDY